MKKYKTYPNNFNFKENKNTKIYYFILPPPPKIQLTQYIFIYNTYIHI